MYPDAHRHDDTFRWPSRRHVCIIRVFTLAVWKFSGMSLNEMRVLAAQIRAAYDAANAGAGRGARGPVHYLAGLAGDVGELSNLILEKLGHGDLPGVDVDAGLVHELSDCIWSVLTLADLDKVDLAATFPAEMKKLLDRVASEAAGGTDP